MPTYEYACKFCGRHHEVFQSMNDAPLRRCPACKKNGLKRLISGGAGIIFKGSGFYETDYKRQAPTAEQTAADKPAAAKPGGDAAGKATESPKASDKTKPNETKPAAKSDGPKAKTEGAKK